MRLRSCVALELLAGASILSALGLGGVWLAQKASAKWERQALAAAMDGADRAEPRTGDVGGDDATPTPGVAAIASRDPATASVAPIAPIPEGDLPEPVDTLDDPFNPSAGRYETVFAGTRDGVLLAPLREAPLKRVKFNRGGSSISLRVDFGNGSRAAFKPQQTNPQTVPRKEIAAFRINRLLGLSSVPPAIGRKFSANDFYAAIDAGSQAYTPRLREEIITRDGAIIGELSWWIPVIERAKVDGYEIDSTDGIVTWKRYLTVGRDIPETAWDMTAQISNMVLFDFIINNPDRWSGANARVSEDGKFLYFMDNTLSFGAESEGHRRVRTYLERSQRFSRAMIARLRALTDVELRRGLSGDLGPYSWLLTDRELEAVLSRREYALRYIDGLIAAHGEAEVLFFP